MEPVKLVIERSKWGRGMDGGGLLLDPNTGLMCCLGFECLRLDIPRSSILGLGMPDEVAEDLQDKLLETGLTCQNPGDEYDNSSYASQNITHCLAAANDANNTTDETKEALIKELFLKLTPPRIVEFVD